jgi:hypothetical protein
MRIFLLFLAFTTLQGPTPTPSKVGKPPLEQTTFPNQAAAVDHRGTEQSPLIVKMLPSVKTKEESDQEAQDRKTRRSSDRWTVSLTGVLALVAFLQLLVYAYQAKKLRETVESAKEQSEAMERHISEASRSAKAMEDVVKVINFGNHAALRAYLTVIIGSAIYQEQREGMDDLKFEAKPLVMNTGNTAARNVSFKKAAAILPIPIPKDFQFPLPEEETVDAGALGSKQTYVMNAVVEDMVPWADVGSIKKGISKALCIWGTITYDDVFGGQHYTKFGQIMTWQLDGKATFGHYIPGQNDGN